MLDGLTTAAQYSPQTITDALLSWRKSGLAAANQQEKDFGPPSSVVLRKRVRLQLAASGHLIRACLHYPSSKRAGWDQLERLGCR